MPFGGRAASSKHSLCDAFEALPALLPFPCRLARPGLVPGLLVASVGLPGVGPTARGHPPPGAVLHAKRCRIGGGWKGHCRRRRGWAGGQSPGRSPGASGAALQKRRRPRGCPSGLPEAGSPSRPRVSACVRSCASTNSARNMSVFVGQIFLVFFNNPLALSVWGVVRLVRRLCQMRGISVRLNTPCGLVVQMLE